MRLLCCASFQHAYAGRPDKSDTEEQYAKKKCNHYLNEIAAEYQGGVPHAIAAQHKMYFWRLGRLDEVAEGGE